jgi:hypothetical protein
MKAMKGPFSGIEGTLTCGRYLPDGKETGTAEADDLGHLQDCS